MKRRLIREAISEEQQEQYLDMFANIPADERKRIREVIKECLEKYAPGLVFTGGFALLGIMVLTIGIKFKSWQTTLAGFAMLATGGTMIGIAERKSILLCAAKELGMDLGDMLSQLRGEEESTEVMPESRRVVKLTESDLNRIVRRIITEQTDEKDLIRGIQRFLNQKLKLNLEIDGKTGKNSETEKAIMKYQQQIKCYPADGTWGPETWEKMSAPDREKLKAMVAKEGGLLDQLMNWMGF
jgi:hypothetical protein